MSGSVVAPRPVVGAPAHRANRTGSLRRRVRLEGRRQLPHRHQPGRRDQAPIRTGVNVGYSAEYKSGETNLALLRSVAKLPPEGGPPGVLVEEGPHHRRPAAARRGQPLPARPAARGRQPFHLAHADPHRELRLLRRRVRPPRAGGLRLARAALGTRGGGDPPTPPGGARAGNHEPPAEPEARSRPADRIPPGGRPVSSPPKRAPPPTPSPRPRPKKPANKSPPTSPNRRPKTPPKESPTPNAS